MSYKRIYIAGPMTGLPNFNFKAFDKVAKGLSDHGWHVENPAEMARRKLCGRNELPKWELEELIAEEIGVLVGCDAIYLLRGWERSKGARKELYHALGNGLEIILNHNANTPKI